MTSYTWCTFLGSKLNNSTGTPAEMFCLLSVIWIRSYKMIGKKNLGQGKVFSPFFSSEIVFFEHVPKKVAN